MRMERQLEVTDRSRADLLAGENMPHSHSRVKCERKKISIALYRLVVIIDLIAHLSIYHLQNLHLYKIACGIRFSQENEIHPIP